MVATAVQYRLFSWRLIRAMFKGWLGKSRIGHYLTATLGTPTSLETIRLLDVGAGNGWFVRLMTDLGWEAWGVEPDPTAAHDAETRAKVPVISASFDAALFPPSTWDVITFRHVFEHLPDPVSTIKAADTLLKPGGRLVILCTNTASIGARQFQDEWRGWEVPRHVFMYNPSNLARLVTTAGSFTIEVLETVLTPTLK
ncbi:Methyltransferase type 11 [Sulfobacillus acidophilus TPY]|nr:Methyltransferase type 11 [Sulfobacillus acidophilus TPY]